MRGRELVGVDVEQRCVAELGVTGVGPQQSGDDAQQGGFPGAVGAEDGDGLARSETEGDIEVSGAQGSVQVEGLVVLASVVGCLGERLKESPTTATATATRRSERATAASASVSRCR